MRYAYLQFDGIGNAANSHRLVGNLFDVKLRAIENLWSAGVDIVPVVTIVNGVNNEQVGRIIQFALDNPRKINFLSFQPVSFTGRDEEVTPERRAAQRYTLSHLAHDVKNQMKIGEPVRDWFPISFMGTFTDWADLVHGPTAEWGNLTCGCHPNCGIGMAVMIDKETKEAVPFTAFVQADTLAKDLRRVNDAARGRFLSVVGMALALMKNYDPFKAPTHFKLTDLMKKFDKTFGATGHNYGKVTADRTKDDIQMRRADRWNFLFIAGMWFQDLFNYDFRRTERCIIPYATQEGEISFCAYNTGIGWRNIIEKMHMTATLTKWYEEHGRHEIFAGNKHVPLNSKDHRLVLDPEAVAAGKQTDLDDAGIAKTAREEKLRARAEAKKKSDPEAAQMEALYRQHVLKEQPTHPDPGPRRREEEVRRAGSAAQAAAVGLRYPGLGIRGLGAHRSSLNGGGESSRRFCLYARNACELFRFRAPNPRAREPRARRPTIITPEVRMAISRRQFCEGLVIGGALGGVVPAEASGAWCRRRPHRQRPARTSATCIPSCRDKRIARLRALVPARRVQGSSRLAAYRPGAGLRSPVLCAAEGRCEAGADSPDRSRRLRRGVPDVPDHSRFADPGLRAAAEAGADQRRLQSSSSTATTASTSGARRRSSPSSRSIPIWRRSSSSATAARASPRSWRGAVT